MVLAGSKDCSCVLKFYRPGDAALAAREDANVDARREIRPAVRRGPVGSEVDRDEGAQGSGFRALDEVELLEVRAHVREANRVRRDHVASRDRPSSDGPAAGAFGAA